MADIKIKITTSADLAALENTRKSAKGLNNDIDAIGEGLTKKLIGKAALVTATFKAFQFAMELVKPALEGVSNATGRVTEALGTIVTRSGVIQGATAGIRVALETLAETLEANVRPNLLKLAQNVADVGARFGNAAVAADRFARAEKNSKEQAGELNTKLNDRLGLLDKLEKRDLGRQQDQKDIELAKVEGKKIPEADKIRERGAIEDKFARMEVNRIQRTLDAKVQELDRAIAELDDRIVAAATNIPDRDRLLGDVGIAQGAADAEREAKRANREAFARRELLRGNEPGQNRFTALEGARMKQPGARTPEEAMLVDMVEKAGGYSQAVSAADARLGQTRARLASATEARKTAFAALPSGVAAPDQAIEYARKEELRQREIIAKTQVEQEAKGTERQQTTEQYLEVGQRGEQQAEARRLRLNNQLQAAFDAELEKYHRAMMKGMIDRIKANTRDVESRRN